jgi:hybrid cluster-associated redox disulfide protein
MDSSVKRFIYAALFYFSVGAVLGFLQAINATWVTSLRFSHVHILLLGFMAMMVYGIGYFILPRFSSTTLLWPGLVNIHFWLANLALIGMVIFKPLALAYYPAPMLTGLFYAAAVAQVIGVFMFVSNLGITLLTAPPLHVPAASSQPAYGSSAATPAGTPVGAPSDPPVPSGPALTPDSPVADWVDRKEGARELLVAAGLKPVADPAHMEMVRKVGVTLSHACMKHGMPLGELFEQLTALPDNSMDTTLSIPTGGGCGGGPVQPAPTGLLGIESKTPITPETLIGKMVEDHPATKPVLQERFGSGCFTCPGFATETLTQGAMMHGVQVQDLVAELKAIVKPDC